MGTGGLIVGPLIYFFAREAKGHGVPEVMEAVALRGGRIRPRVVIAKLVASGVCIGSGGSVGREGPIVQIGAAIGSSLGQVLQLGTRRLRTLAGCGAAAGIAAVIHVPGDEATIANALSSAAPYDTVLVAPGTYFVNATEPTVVERSTAAAPRPTGQRARIDGWPVAIMASDPFHYGGAWTSEACQKIVRHVDMAETFHLPMIYLADCPGFLVGKDAERGSVVCGKNGSRWVG